MDEQHPKASPLDAHRDHDTRTRWERLRRRDQAFVLLVMVLAGLAYAVAFGLLP